MLIFIPVQSSPNSCLEKQFVTFLLPAICRKALCDYESKEEYENILSFHRNDIITNIGMVSALSKLKYVQYLSIIIPLSKSEYDIYFGRFLLYFRTMMTGTMVSAKENMVYSPRNTLYKIQK